MTGIGSLVAMTEVTLDKCLQMAQTTLSYSHSPNLQTLQTTLPLPWTQGRCHFVSEDVDLDGNFSDKPEGLWNITDVSLSGERKSFNFLPKVVCGTSTATLRAFIGSTMKCFLLCEWATRWSQADFRLKGTNTFTSLCFLESFWLNDLVSRQIEARLYFLLQVLNFSRVCYVLKTSADKHIYKIPLCL
jgi:hypothetical protein